MSESSITTEEAYKKNLINRLVSKAGLRGKIDAMCIVCVYDPYQPGTWRSQVARCTCMSCPLHADRATTTNKNARTE